MKMKAAEVLDLISLSLIRFSFMFKHLLDALQWIHNEFHVSAFHTIAFCGKIYPS